MGDLQIDLSIIDDLFLKWQAENEDATSYLDVKLCVRKNKEFRNKT